MTRGTAPGSRTGFVRPPFCIRDLARLRSARQASWCCPRMDGVRASQPKPSTFCRWSTMMGGEALAFRWSSMELQHLLLRQQVARSGVSVAPASSRVRAADGQWLSLHGSRLRGGDDDHRIAVVVEPGSAQAVMPVLLAGYGLSSREAQVATLVLRGESTLAIVDLLHISRHTVQDHLKVVFDKAGVRSRRE